MQALLLATLLATAPPGRAAEPAPATPTVDAGAPTPAVDATAVEVPEDVAGDNAAYLRFAERRAANAVVADYRARDDAEPYHFDAEVHAELGAAMARWPGRVQAVDLGSTVKGRRIWAFRVHDPGHPVQHKLLVFANIHAMEWISTEVALRFLLDVIERPPPGVEIAVVPILNPDGRHRVEVDLIEGDTTSYHRGNANLVDLNRDWPDNREPRAIWRKIIPSYYKTSPAPLSQPETRALDALAAEGWDAAVSLHAFGGYHFLPWTGRWERPDDWERLVALGRTMQSGQGAHAYKVMQLSRWMFFFRGHGMEIDHLYGSYGIPSVLVELTRSGITRRADLKTPFRWYNPRQPDRHVEQGAGALRAIAWTMSWSTHSGDPVPWLAP